MEADQCYLVYILVFFVNVKSQSMKMKICLPGYILLVQDCSILVLKIRLLQRISEGTELNNPVSMQLN